MRILFVSVHIDREPERHRAVGVTVRSIVRCCLSIEIKQALYQRERRKMSSFKKSVNGNSNGWETNNNNNNNNYVIDKRELETKKNTIRIRDRLEINEWTFSLFLFCFSLSIVIGKLFLNYGEALERQVKRDYRLPSLPVFDVVSNFSGLPNLDSTGLRFNGDKLINASRRYEEAVSEAVVEFSAKNWTWMRAAISGLAMMGFTWYIVYKDSSVPGVNPPSPLSLLQKRGQPRSGMQINYFVGILNGILIFVYLTL